MISNYYNFIVNDKQIKLREISFTEYKNICKKLFSDDLTEIDNTFNEILQETCISTPLNCLEKFYTLVLLRNLTYGNEFNFTMDGARVVFDLKTVLQNINFKLNDIVIECNNIKYIFNLPQNLLNNTIDGLIADSLKKVILPNNEVDCSVFTYKQKLEAINQSPLPVFEVYNTLKEQFLKLNIEFIHDIELDIMSGAFLVFLKRIFNDNMETIYNFEYICIRSLNLHAEDMSRYTLPELKIFLQSFKSEQESKQNVTPGLKS